jgi:branched-subunit amino acid transport protein
VIEWLTILAAGAGTYGIRLTFLVFVHHRRLPLAVREALAFVTPAVLAAIAIPAVLYPGADGAFQPLNARLPAALVAVVLARLSGNVWATIGGGMVALWTFDALA